MEGEDVSRLDRNLTSKSGKSMRIHTFPCPDTSHLSFASISCAGNVFLFNKDHQKGGLDKALPWRDF
jgi:hypothetical protein